MNNASSLENMHPYAYGKVDNVIKTNQCSSRDVKVSYQHYLPSLKSVTSSSS